MPTLFCVYNLKKDADHAKYGEYLTKTKIPGIRGAPWCTGFQTWKVEKVLAPAVSAPEGDLPKEPPYQYLAKLEVSDLGAMVSFLGTDAGKEFMQSWSVFLDPTSIFTMTHEV
jgi:hypothetical protein